MANYRLNAKAAAVSSTNAVAYIRVSDEKQLQGESLDTQKERILAYAAIEGLTIVKWFIEEGVSAKNADRPQLKAMLQHCAKNKGKIGFVVFYKMQRASRDIQSYMLQIKMFLTSMGVKVRSATEPIDDTKFGRFMESFYLLTGQLDNETKSEVVTDNMKRLSRQGYWLHGSLLGYTTTKVNNDEGKARPTLQPNKTLEKVGDVLLRFGKGDISQAELIKYAYDIGLRSVNGKRLNQNAIYRLLTQPAYAGYVHSSLTDYEMYEAQFKGVITLEQFMRNQRLLEKNTLKRKGISYSVNNELYPLKKFALCSSCKKPLHASAPKTGSGAYSPRYHCARADCKGKVKSVKAATVHEQFVAVLKSIKPDSGTVKLYREILRRQAVKELGNLNRDIRQQRHALDDIARARLEALIKCNNGELSTDEKNELLAAYEVQKISAKETLYDLEQRQAIQEANINYALNFMQDAAQQWADASLELRQRFQTLVFPEGVLYDTLTGVFGTTQISPLYRYIGNKKDLSAKERSLVVTPAG